MADYRKTCGSETIDEYDNRHSYRDPNAGSVYYSTTHRVSGSGIVTSNNTPNRTDYEDTYEIGLGITELGDSCLNSRGITSVSLPKTLVKIGTSCFRNSRITSIALPESLVEIGHTNFPSTLRSITIPVNLEIFPTDNLQGCKELSAIRVDQNNKAFKSIDGVLYNYDVTEVLLCPRDKSGKVILPKTVKRIAEKCFQNCVKVTMIDMPIGLEFIGEYALSGIKIDRLVIPNSVTFIGAGCFSNTTISKSFRFPHKITELQSGIFNGAVIPSLDFLKNIEIFGDSCFSCLKLSGNIVSGTEYLRLPKIRHLGSYSFRGPKNIKYIELPSTLSYIGGHAFDSTADNLNLICFSIVPIHLIDDSAFVGLSENATLFVPKGTKIIYENTSPWSTIHNIEEFDIEKDFQVDDGEVSEEQLYYRLYNIGNSARNVNREAMARILCDIVQSYKYVDNTEDYKDAIELIKYNRRFTPALMPNLEKEIGSEWSAKYKLKLASTYLFDSTVSPRLFAETTSLYVESETVPALPLLTHDKMELFVSEQLEAQETEIHFCDILQQIQSELLKAASCIRIAVSWFTNFALFKQIKELACKGVTVQLIINNDSVNNGGYCLNFNELIDAGVQISLVEYPHLIHHKFCVIDDNVVINGSYNWTRLSGNNYENIMIFRGNDYVVKCFNDEFDRIMQLAEHKSITAMHECVPPRPEYDRNAFKQYITEELDAEAREMSEQRDKITPLQKAAKLNPEYFDILNPGMRGTLEEARRVVEQSFVMTKEIVSIANGEKDVQEKESNEAAVSTPTTNTSTTKTQSSQTTAPNNGQASIIGSKKPTLTEAGKNTLETIKASSLFMVLDVSGSMKDTYKAGHVYSITKKAVSAALAISDSQKVSLWEFGDSSSFITNISLKNIEEINKVNCKNTGTVLNNFIIKANNTIKEDSLVIVFTDDDGCSITGAVPGMKTRNNVFWQIIVVGSHSRISKAIDGCENVSIVAMDNYASKSDSEINQALLKDYIEWKKRDSQKK